MELQVYLAFVIATSIMIALPGPSVLLTVANSISHGWKHGMYTVVGETAGIAVQLLIAALGLVSLLDVAAEAFEWLRWAGAIYLIYLGIKQWLSANKPTDLDTSSATKKNVFVQGLVVTTFNPKSLIFIGAFLPQFIDASLPLETQLFIIVPSFLVITFAVASAWALAAGKLRGVLKSPRVIKSVSRTSGGLMILAGVGLILARRAK